MILNRPITMKTIMKPKNLISLAIALCMAMSTFAITPVIGAGINGSDSLYTASAKTKKILGTPCIKQDGIWFPKALGKGKLTNEQLKELGQSDDLEYLRKKINTLPDAVRFFIANDIQEGDGDSYTSALIRRECSNTGMCEAIAFLLSDNYKQTGLLRCYSSKDYWCMGYVKKGKTYYAINPADVAFGHASLWMGYVKAGKYVSPKMSVIKKRIKKNYHGINGKIKRVEAEKFNLPKPPVDTPIYSNAQIQELVKAGLSLEEAAAKISTISDAINYMTARGYTVGKFSYNPNLWYNDIAWNWGLSADFTYDHNAGTCAGTSNLFNRLLKDDFDDEGYVELRTNEGGHVFNWFMRDGVYYFCDFAGHAFTDDPYAYLQYKTTKPETFAKYYLATNSEFNDKKAEGYLMNLYMYSRNGQNKLPCGKDPNGDQIKPNGDIFSDKYPDTIENLKILFIRDGYTMNPAKAPTEAEMPPETHIPDDDGNYYD